VPEYLEIEGALGGETFERVLAAMRAASGADAGVLGAEPGERVASSARRASRLTVPDSVRAAVAELLEALRPRIAEHFGRELDSCEEPQFLRYTEGDYFVAHQDGNTPLVHDTTRFRKVSVVVFLSEQSAEPRPGAFGGGTLVLHGRYQEPGEQVPLAPAPGTLVAFAAETTHEVTPIAHGERLTIVSWYRDEADGGD
jgi:SM-20-related protein